MSNYIRIRDGNMDLLGNYFQQARGLRAGNKFARDCGLTARTFYKVLRGEYLLKNIPEPTLIKVTDHIDKRCGLTEENLRAANGEIDWAYLDGLLRYEKTRRPDKEDVQPPMLCGISADGEMSAIAEGEDLLSEERPEEDIHDGAYTDEYLAYVKFVAQMSVFMSGLPDAQKKFILTKVRQLYHDAAFCFLLNQYSEYRQAEEDGMYGEGSLKERFLDMKGDGDKAAVCFQLLKDYVLMGTRKWDTEKGIYDEEE